MLATPLRGFGRSVTAHNNQLDAMAEWVEGSVTFACDSVSQNEIVDILMENGFYVSQDFAQARVDDIWTELASRSRFLSSHSSYEVGKSRVTRARQWSKVPSFSFCLMLGLQVAYRSAFRQNHGDDYTEQGQLFEELTAAALSEIGMKTHSTGWSHITSESIAEKVTSLATHLGEAHRGNEVPRWTAERAKDGGLDVICHIPFCDSRAGRPLYFVQCASGENWKEKRGTPNLKLWNKLLDLATEPTKAIAHPFALLEEDFRREANYDSLSLVMDRHRLSRPSHDSKPRWIAPALAKRLNSWTRKRIPTLTKL